MAYGLMDELRAQMSRAAINDLPDSAFAYIEPGGSKDETGRTVPRSLRHFPVHDADHVRAALTRIGQGARFGDKAMGKVRKAAHKYGVTISEPAQRDLNIDDASDDEPGEHRNLSLRNYNFELRSVDRSGRRLVGTVAMFNRRTRIPDRGGDFEEELHPGFARRSLREFGMPVMQYDHGKCARTGTVPIGRYDSFQETRTGYDVEGELFDNALVEPIRQAIQGGAIKGMSFRFHVVKGGDKWEKRGGTAGMDLRYVKDADVPEAGPVVFPAYRDTKVAVRSLLASLSDDELAEAIRELRDLAGLATDLRDTTDLTGAPDTWSAGRGDYDTQPREGSASTSNSTANLLRDRAVRLMRNALP